MHYETAVALNAAEKWVRVLVDECRRRTSLYSINPKAVANVGRTGKSLLHAIAKLNQELVRPNQIRDLTARGITQDGEERVSEETARKE